MRAPGIALAALSTAVAIAGGPRAAEALDLTGTWHVLIHYTDDLAHDPGAMRWDDRVWVFEPEGERLRWTEYPLVVFKDRSGRFEQARGGMVRVVHAWEPNPGQLAQIQEGLEINTRGSKSKALRRSGGDWRSSMRGSAASAGVITYQESWSIEDAAGLPVFIRDDVLGGGMAESFEGRTLYETATVSTDEAMLRGRFERDGTRHGTFRMRRAGGVGVVEGSGRTQEQRTMAFFAAMLGSDALREEVRGEIERGLRTQGVDPEAHPEAVAAATDAAVEEVSKGIREGVGEAELRKRIAARTSEALASPELLRAQVRPEVEAAFRRRGLEPEEYPAEVERVTGIATEEVSRGLRAGKSRASIDRAIERRLERELAELSP